MSVEGPKIHHKTNLRNSSHIWIEQTVRMGAMKPEFSPHLQLISSPVHILSFAAIKKKSVIFDWENMHFSPFWLFTGALRDLVISIWAIWVMPCYGLSGKPFTIIKSGHRMESSLKCGVREPQPRSRELWLDYTHAPLTLAGLPSHVISTAAYWIKRNA